MIGKISGKLEIIRADSVLIDVGGIGYLVNISNNTKNGLSEEGENISLYTEMLVREDSIQLIGFSSMIEKEWFLLLTSVQGVGFKAALAILGTVSLRELSRSIILGNAEYITAAPGIGPKIAKRILLELAQKALKLGSDQLDESSTEGYMSNQKEDNINDVNHKLSHVTDKTSEDSESEAVFALVKLGYDRLTSTRVVGKICDGQEKLEISDIIRLSLKHLASE